MGLFKRFVMKLRAVRLAPRLREGVTHEQAMSPSTEQFRAMLIEALDDPATARLVAKRLLLPVFPIQGGQMCNTPAGDVAHGDFGSICTDSGDYTFSRSKVGIGTTTPSGKLHIVGGYQSSGLTSATANELRINSGGASPDAAQIIWGDNSGWKLHFGTRDSGANFVPRVTFVATGNVGIGTTSPQVKLHVKSGSDGIGLQIEGDDNKGRLGFLKTGVADAANVMYRDSADFTVLRNFNQLYTNMTLRAPTNPSGTAEREATLALVRVDSQDNDLEFLDLYNNGYTSETQYGIRIQRLKDSGVFRDFVFSQRQQNPATHTFTDYPEIAVVRATRKVGIGTRTTPAKLSVKGESFTATGTLFSASGTTVTGTGSLFMQEIDPGDKVTISGQTRTVLTVVSETSLTIDSSLSASAATMMVVNQLFRVDDSSGNVKVFVTDQGNVGIGTGGPGATLDVVGGVISKRLTPNRGTALVAGDFALSGGWGTVASLAVGANSDDQRGTITITSAGTGQSANPTITLTFKDGAWTNAPFALSKMEGGTGVITNLTETTTTTTLVITFLGTPVTGKTYVISWLILG